jgi:hypothetical protein
MQESVGENLLEVLFACKEDQRGETTTAVVIGKVVELTDGGEPLVDFSSNPSGFPLSAKSLVRLGQEALGAEVALLFETGDICKPIIMGVIQAPKVVAKETQILMPGQRGSVTGVECDGGKVVVSAEREIVLRCGEASITLTRAGKILIKGTYVLSRSSGVNRVKGGSVQIN